MSTLPTNLRRQLETAIKQARKIAEGGARKALEALAVHEADPYRHMDEVQRDLRRKLRAQAKQLGDGESRVGAALTRSSTSSRSSPTISGIGSSLPAFSWRTIYSSRQSMKCP